MERSILLKSGNKRDPGVLIEYNDENVCADEIETEIEKIIKSPRIRKLSKKEIGMWLVEYERRIKDLNPEKDKQSIKELRLISSLIEAASAYWDQQGIEYGDTEAIIKNINQEHEDWDLRIGNQCEELNIW